jgi:hypothetical protein
VVVTFFKVKCLEYSPKCDQDVWIFLRMPGSDQEPREIESATSTFHERLEILNMVGWTAPTKRYARKSWRNNVLYAMVLCEFIFCIHLGLNIDMIADLGHHMMGQKVIVGMKHMEDGFYQARVAFARPDGSKRELKQGEIASSALEALESVHENLSTMHRISHPHCAIS